MITSIFEALSSALQASPFFAISAAFVWGILSILLSPCHLASIPLIVGFINEQGSISTKKAFILSFLFSIGNLVAIAVVGIITALIGRMMGDIGPWANYIVAAVFFLIGLHLLGFIPLPFINGVNQPGIKRKGFLASFLLGLIFGIALGPCAFAYMAPMIAITFSVSFAQVWYGVLLLFAYGVGHCFVIILAGTFTEKVEQYLKWNEASRGTIIIKKICGLLIIAAGGYLIFLNIQ